MRTCQYYDGEPCINLAEGNTDYCGTHNRLLRKQQSDEQKAAEKAEKTLKKAKLKQMQPKKEISKNPTDWSNRSVCSDGTRVSQSVIGRYYKSARIKKYGLSEGWKCEGCGKQCVGSAHIIAQARCKVIGKTELIWDPRNFFPACNACNAAIENPSGNDWKRLKNIDKCLSFIKEHDPELFTKFELFSSQWF